LFLSLFGTLILRNRHLGSYRHCACAPFSNQAAGTDIFQDHRIPFTKLSTHFIPTACSRPFKKLYLTTQISSKYVLQMGMFIHPTAPFEMYYFKWSNKYFKLGRIPRVQVTSHLKCIRLDSVRSSLPTFMHVGSIATPISNRTLTSQKE